MSADVIVVGAGVVGRRHRVPPQPARAPATCSCSTADTAGSGMSSRSSAMVRMHYTFRPEVELAVRSDRDVRRLDRADRPPGVSSAGPGSPASCRRARRRAAAGQRGHAARAAARGPRSSTPPASPRLAPGIRTDDLDRGGLGAERRLRGRRAGGRRPAGRGPGRGACVPAAHAGPGAAAPTATGSPAMPDRRTGPEHAGTVVRAAGVWSPALLAARRRRPADRDRTAPGRGAQPRAGPAAPRWPASTRPPRPTSGPRRAGSEDAGRQLHRHRADADPDQVSATAARRPDADLATAGCSLVGAAARGCPRWPTPGSPAASPACTT